MKTILKVLDMDTYDAVIWSAVIIGGLILSVAL